MWRWLLVLVVLLAAAAGVVVGWLNPGEVTVDLLIASFAIPLGVPRFESELGRVVGEKFDAFPSHHASFGVPR